MNRLNDNISIILQHNIDIQNMESNLDFRSTSNRKIYDLRVTGIPGVMLLGHYKYQRAGQILKRHKHKNMFEICYLDSGKQVYEIESREYLLKGGDILLTKPNQVHGTSNYPESVGSLYWIILKSPDNHQSLLGLNNNWSKALYSEILNAPHVHFSGNQRIRQRFRMLESQCKSRKQPIDSLHIFNTIVSIVLEVVELSKVNNTLQLPGDIERVLTYINENIWEQLTIDELSEITDLSQSRFKHKFREHIGRSPIDYINSKKIEKAKEIISTTASMKEVGYKLGYSSPAYFSHVFKKYTRMTPLEYKMNLLDI